VNAAVGDAIRGFSLLPKQANDLMSCEVLRMLKLTSEAVQPVAARVPRKEKLKFHADLFPPTAAGGTPALGLRDWLDGAAAAPVRVELVNPMLPGGSAGPAGGPGARDSSASDAGSDRDSAASAASATSNSNSSSSSSNSNRRSRVTMSLASNLKFRHMFGVENSKPETFFNLSPQASFSDNALIAASDLYFAIPYQGE
jgi:hypothetical protein